MKLLPLSVFLLLIPLHIWASDGIGGRLAVSPHVGDSLFEDLFLHADFTYAPNYDKLGFMFHLGAGVRPFPKKVYVDNGAMVDIYREHRFNLELLVEKDFFISSSFGCYIQGGGIATFGWYRGSTDKADNGLTPAVGGGIAVPLGSSFKQIPACTMKIGYQWQDQKSTSAHTINLSFIFLGRS